MSNARAVQADNNKNQISQSQFPESRQNANSVTSLVLLKLEPQTQKDPQVPSTFENSSAGGTTPSLETPVSRQIQPKTTCRDIQESVMAVDVSVKSHSQPHSTVVSHQEVQSSNQPSHVEGDELKLVHAGQSLANRISALDIVDCSTRQNSTMCLTNSPEEHLGVESPKCVYNPFLIHRPNHSTQTSQISLIPTREKLLSHPHQGGTGKHDPLNNRGGFKSSNFGGEENKNYQRQNLSESSLNYKERYVTCQDRVIPCKTSVLQFDKKSQLENSNKASSQSSSKNHVHAEKEPVFKEPENKLIKKQIQSRGKIFGIECNFAPTRLFSRKKSPAPIEASCDGRTRKPSIRLKVMDVNENRETLQKTALIQKARETEQNELQTLLDDNNSSAEQDVHQMSIAQFDYYHRGKRFVQPCCGPGTVVQTCQSPALRALVDMGNRKPSVDEIFSSLPFVEYCRVVQENNFGVIKIKNIPYSISRSEVLAFLGRNARLIAESDNEPVHIVMERVTSKTLDCYVEFINFEEALNAVHRFDQSRVCGRSCKIGQRRVEVELSSQESLMADLFPKAKNVKWSGSIPTIQPRDTNDNFNSGFQGFISKEELIMLIKHVEVPLRSPFSKECPQRPFECLISTLYKFPWFMVNHITIEDRDFLHRTTMQMLRFLRERVISDHSNMYLTPMLYKRVWRAALRCRGFSPSQKDDIVLLVGLPWEKAQEFGLPPFAAFWKHLWTIGAHPSAPCDLIMWYIARIREFTVDKKQLSLAEKATQGDNIELELFGLLHKHIDYGNHSEFKKCTLAQVAEAEWAGMEKILRGIFDPLYLV
ncbi:BgTH12-07369 [Blumeria graminis f. sp. triticale]|uniref:BgTH12-07369 n=1 Tax=Blumeria graminis f. sp. triticale TaxID=1689686 RepID=A0A9W4D964_BLUGR|nr:BgTH12-07369 [Blumeria graminis f. sp. triticale]